MASRVTKWNSVEFGIKGKVVTRKSDTWGDSASLNFLPRSVYEQIYFFPSYKSKILTQFFWGAGSEVEARELRRNFQTKFLWEGWARDKGGVLMVSTLGAPR